ncbi:MAG: galactose-1-phosphate uridylyltransferase [Candidatus Eremiobacteraeota bacterium]|nr:galactose-1-phosphate uridylyltransferase [Candidatus Eremiobacteraeota bacterium]
MNELRKDPLTGDWLIIGERIGGKRPFEYEVCPFCPGQEYQTPPTIYTVTDNDSWLIRVVPDRYPVLQIEGDLNKYGIDMYDRMDGIGAHEIIIESPEHKATLGTMSVWHLTRLLDTWQMRIMDLKKDRRFSYVLVFRNQGPATGVFTAHPYSQVVATPFIPPVIKPHLKHMKMYYELKERCILCDAIAQVRRENSRLIAETRNFIALSPFASRSMYETMILPCKHYHEFETQNTRENLEELARFLKRIITAIESLMLENPSHTLIINTSPNLGCEYDAGDQWKTIKEDFHWFIHIMPHPQPMSGFERGTGIHTNVLLPEKATSMLREKLATIPEDIE